MSASTEVAKPQSTEVAGFSEADLDALNASITGATKESDLVLPLITLAQGLSASVSDGDAKAGEWVNSLTKENYGAEFEFSVAGFFYGKAYRDADKGFFGAAIGDRIPDNWPHKDAGKLFEESDDYEDRFRELVNSGEREWGKGPPISTTYNFVGYRPGHADIPERISLMRTGATGAKKLLTLLSTDRRVWDHVYTIRSTREEANNSTYYAAEIGRAGATAPEDIQKLVELAVSLKRAEEAGGIALAGDQDTEPDASAKGAKKSEGGLDL